MVVFSLSLIRRPPRSPGLLPGPGPPPPHRDGPPHRYAGSRDVFAWVPMAPRLPQGGSLWMTIDGFLPQKQCASREPCTRSVPAGGLSVWGWLCLALVFSEVKLVQNNISKLNFPSA